MKMQLLEKITLYDILGYAMPGNLLLIALTGNKIPQMLKWIPKEMQNHMFYFILVFIVCGYFSGIALSEISNLLGKKLWEVKIVRKTTLPSLEHISKALKNAGVVGKKEQISEDDLREKYCSIIYNDIQTDVKYNRIHNYKSAELMYRNMIFVVFIGGIWIVFMYPLNGCIRLTVSLIMILFVSLFYRRWLRFLEKTIRYPVEWFVLKYNGK